MYILLIFVKNKQTKFTESERSRTFLDVPETFKNALERSGTLTKNTEHSLNAHFVLEIFGIKKYRTLIC
jgi:hypothetical protein